MRIRHSPSIRKREDFGKLLYKHTKTGLAAEIGTHRAEFAATLLAHWPEGTLLCVDPWRRDIEGYRDPIQGGSDRAADFAKAKDRLSSFHDRYVMLRGMSSEVAPLIVEDSLDMVYIDANHNRKYVKEDLELWIPKVRTGGIVAGHDFNGDWEDEVRPVVEAKAEKLGVRDLYFILGDAASWYFLKP